MLKIVIRNGTTQKTFVTEFSVTKKINTQVFLPSDVRPIKRQRNNDKYIQYFSYNYDTTAIAHGANDKYWSEIFFDNTCKQYHASAHSTLVI